VAGVGRHEADEVLAAHLASGKPLAAAARAVEVSETTVRRRLADPAFRRLLDQRKAELVGEAVALLGKSMSAAAGELVRLMTESADQKIKLMAAKEILAAGLKARQALDLERRLDDLEAAMGAGDGHVHGPAEPTGGPGPEADHDDGPDAGGDPGGPVELVQVGRDDPGPVAGPATPLDGESGVAPLFEAGGQEHDGRGAGSG
jgi:hypothetical protein